MSDPLLRQWEMLKLIPRERKITVKELQSKLDGLGFAVTRRTLERDLDRLSSPFCIESDTRSKPYGWRYALNMKSPSIPGLTTSEALTLLLLENYLKNLLPVAVADNLASQFAAARQFFGHEHPELKLQDWLRRVHVLPPGQPLLAPDIDPRIQRDVYDAFLHGLQLEMSYLTSGASEAKHYSQVHLQALVQYGYVIYLVVTINDHTDLRLLALHRIQAVEIKRQPSHLLPDFDLQQYIAEGGFGFGDVATTENIRLEVMFSNGAGNHLLEAPLAIDQHAERLDSKRLKITVNIPQTPNLIWWLTSFGPDIEVLAPDAVRQEIAERHRLAAQQYTSS
jgi:predicted DNA-binding transcriptional regulator YafY